ncbi:CPBP family intramembrane metalloprotease [Dyella jejuensis]|uniref:CPBP family intramembrane metalloprotease n=1 Tax=Dyella jejuensis TaxID=1432009 RepID=A0ABW8JLN7_9GAMM
MNANAPVVFRTPVWLYFTVAFAISWMVWLLPVLASRDLLKLSPGLQLVCLLGGSFGPFIGAFFCVYRDGGWAAVREFAGRSLRYRISPVHVLCAVLLAPLAASVTMWWLARHGGPAFALLVPLSQIPLVFVELFFIGGSVNEEFGWAYAIDRLQQRRSLLRAAVLLGIIWGCWHLPLFFVIGLTQSFMPFWAFLIFTIALRVLIVWVYESNRKSILAALLFHTAGNFSLNLYQVIDRSPQRDERGFIGFALLMLAAALVVALCARCYRSAPASQAALEGGINR